VVDAFAVLLRSPSGMDASNAATIPLNSDAASRPGSSLAMLRGTFLLVLARGARGGYAIDWPRRGVAAIAWHGPRTMMAPELAPLGYVPVRDDDLGGRGRSLVPTALTACSDAAGWARSDEPSVTVGPS